ncbi:MAG: hypothetical protein H7A51_16465 [Akkermansiaceae bacterium]|nr:hypothetical protein [Akkermansiaceae bacterium]
MAARFTACGRETAILSFDEKQGLVDYQIFLKKPTKVAENTPYIKKDGNRRDFF